ncbi:MAG: polysaccharide deacetylase family protein [Planctomycetota bacterium]
MVYLRIDVDSFAGARDGIPRLLEVLARRGVHATFFINLGPDRWGRAIFRVLWRRGFLSKMLRTRALSSYGLATCLRGTLLPTVYIARRLGAVLREIAAAGHEVGAHCWDHVLWQDRLSRLPPSVIAEQVQAALSAFADTFGAPAQAWAAPGWVTTPAALAHLDGRGFRYMSNSRGQSPYLPCVRQQQLRTLEIPVTLPTLDESLGRDGVELHNYVSQLMECMEQTPVRVHTIHTETEGRGHLALFEHLLDAVAARGWKVAPLGQLAADLEVSSAPVPTCEVEYREIPGRAGIVTVQGPAVGFDQGLRAVRSFGASSA